MGTAKRCAQGKRDADAENGRVVRALNIRKFWRWNVSPKARTLFTLVTLGGVGTLIAIIALLHSSLATISAKTNELDTARALDSVQASVTTTIVRMTALVNDNTAWDDAVTELYRPTVDKAWLYSTWGAVSDDAKPYDGTFLIDENDHVLWGYFRGKPFTGDISFFGPGYHALIQAHRATLEDGETAISGMTETSAGVAVVGIGLVRPSEGALKGKGTARRYLVMTRHFTPAMLGDIASTFRIEGLKLTSINDDTAPYLQLGGADGHTLGRLHWKLRMPGAEAARAAAPKIQQITWLVAFLILMFVAVCVYSLFKLGRSEKQAHTIALTDGLSGLPNRRALFERVDSGKWGGQSPERTVVFIDLDGFKDVNDIYGHATGDRLIVTVADALKARMPDGALLARMGGDEFAMLAAGREALALSDSFARQAIDFLKKPIHIGDRTIQIGASIGIASGDIRTCQSQELFRRADMAMYYSKTNGKGRITHYNAEIEGTRFARQQIETGIAEGLKRKEFTVAYQPIVDARTRAVTSVEALVRWPHRPEGALRPDQFIDIAETSGLIHPLGQFVLHQACSELCAVPDLRLSVNISPAQFRDPDFEKKVAAVLKETGFPASRLELEVTEGYLIENPERAIAAIANLKALGCSIALDDFGTGYSSIGYLRRYDFDKIKIDKSLAGRVDQDPQAAALVAGTVSIATALNLSVTAEGVETEDHVRLLKLAGCDTLQGYYFSRPKPLNEILELRDFLPRTA